MPATATKRRPAKDIRCELLEIASGCGKVDVKNGVIRDVKIVGLESRNIGRTIGLDPKEFGDAVSKPYGYSRRALESAIPMYEGSLVRIDHPASEMDANGRRVIKQASRPAMATFGELKKVHMKEDGLYGDLHVIKSHPSAGFVLEVAERMPDKLALSHNAFGVPKLQGGRAVIDEILEVFSVDIVGDKPGTTNGLFESFNEGETVKKTIKKIVESLPAKHAQRACLLEMMDEEVNGEKVEAMEMDVPAEASADEQAAMAIETVVLAVLRDDKLDNKAKLTRLAEILNAGDMLKGEKPAAPAEGAETQESLAENKKLSERLQLLESENAEMKADKHVRALLESMDREVSDVRVESLKALKDDAKRKALIETWPKQEVDTDTGRPRRSLPIVESATEQAANGEEFAKRLK